MTIFVDASAAVSIMTLEDDADALLATMEADPRRIWSAIAKWETTLAVFRMQKRTINDVAADVDELARRLALEIVPIGDAEAASALDAHRRYGKRSGHPANLNMGDCFAYACARTNAATLLYKGDDFSRTDLA